MLIRGPEICHVDRCPHGCTSDTGCKGIEGVKLEHEAFETWYCGHAKSECGFDIAPDQIAAMRDGDNYGDRGYLNGCWQTWKALRTSGVEGKSNG